MLDDPERDRWQKPEEIIRALGIRGGMTVADIGAGSGYLTKRLSRAVGSNGRVLAQEIQEAFIRELRKKARRLDNVEVMRGNAGDPCLPEREVDVLLLLTVYHEIAEPIDFLRKLHNYAKPGARLAIIDFDSARGGRPPAPAGHEMAESAVISEAREAGWKLAKRHEFISSQFFLEFRAASPLARH